MVLYSPSSRLTLLGLLLLLNTGAISAAPVLGDLYMADNGTFNIDQITPGGVSTVYAAQTTLSPNRQPQWLTIRSDGTIFTTNFGGQNQTQQISPTGAQSLLGPGNSYGSVPTGIAWDPNNFTDVLFATANNGILQMNSSTGSYSVLYSGSDILGSIVFGGDGDLYAADSTAGTILHFTANNVKFGTGGGTIFASGLGTATGLAFDAAGNLYVTNQNNVIQKVSTSGQVTTYDTLGGIHASADLMGIAVDGSGDLFVADQTSQSILEITPSLTVSTLASGYSQPLGLALFGAPIPEPGTMAMLIGGLGLLGVVARRHSSR
jgi:sugar lactone lactonase YvrE